MVQTPGARSRRNEVKKNETQHHGDFSEIVYRKPASGKVSSEVSDGHLAAENECSDASTEADQEQDSAGDFEHSGNTEHRKIWKPCKRLAWRKTEQLLSAMLEEEQ